MEEDPPEHGNEDPAGPDDPPDTSVEDPKEEVENSRLRR